MSGTPVTQSGAITTQINSTANTTANPSIPASMTSSHYLLLCVSISGNKTASLNTPGGWSVLGAFLNNSTSVTLAVYGRFWTSGLGAPSVTWTTNNKNVSCIIPWLGVDTGTQMDIAVPTYATGSSTTPTDPTGAAVTMGAARVHIGARAGTGTSAPGGAMFELVDITSSSSSPAALAVDYQTYMADGATNTRFDTTGSAAWVAATIWLRPASPTTFGWTRTARANANGSSVTATLASGDIASPLSGGLIVAHSNIFSNGTDTVTGITYNSGSNVLTKAVSHDANSQYSSTWYYANNTVSGALAVVSSRSGSDSQELWVGELKGAATSSPLDQIGHATITANNTEAVSTDAATNAGTIISLPNYQTDISITGVTYDSNYAALYEQRSAATGRATMVLQARELTGGSVETSTDTITGATSPNGTDVITTFKVPAAGGTPVPALMLLGVG